MLVFHRSLGVTIFAVVVIRLAWRSTFLDDRPHEIRVLFKLMRAEAGHGGQRGRGDTRDTEIEGKQRTQDDRGDLRQHRVPDRLGTVTQHGAAANRSSAFG